MKNRIAATFSKTIRGLLRNKAVLIGAIAWPLLLLVIISFSMLAGLGRDVLPLAIGWVTISMIVFSLMLAGIGNLAGNIARDRESGLLAKLKSLPVSPATDFAGRMLALLAFALIPVLLIVAAGLFFGARFHITAPAVLASLGLLCLITGCAAGIGLIIGSLVKNVMGAIFTGIGFSVITSFLSGIFVPYSSLSTPARAFARIYPISSASSQAGSLLLGQDVIGYNPLAAGQVITTLVLALALLAAGVFLYSRLGWKRD